MTVQIALLLAVAALLMRPWRLATWRRCELCRSSTPKKSHRCRFCGATSPQPVDTSQHAPAPSNAARIGAGDRPAEALWPIRQAGSHDGLGELGPALPAIRRSDPEPV